MAALYCDGGVLRVSVLCPIYSRPFTVVLFCVPGERVAGAYTASSC